MKFIHTADLHLDRPFSHVSGLPEQFHETLNRLNHQMVSRIVDCCLHEQCDFLLIAGDTFHQSLSSIHVQTFFLEQLTRLKEAGIPVVLSFGNHDYYTADRYWFDWPDNVLLFDSAEVTTKLLTTRSGETVAISGFSYDERWLAEGKLAQFPPRVSGADYHIGFYHGEQSAEQPYAPFAIREMQSKGYDYWGLGHIHQPQVLSDAPPIVYPGTPQGRTRKESAAKGVLVVDITPERTVFDWQDVALTGWLEVPVDTSSAESKNDVLLAIIDSCLARLSEGKVMFVTATLQGLKQEWLATILAEKKGLLAFLKQEIFSESRQQVVLVALETEAPEEELLLTGITQEVIDELSRGYATQEVYQQLTKDLMQQPLLAANLQIDRRLVTESLAQAVQLLREKIADKKEV